MKELRDRLKNGPTHDDTAFFDLVEVSMRDLELTDNDISRRLGVARTTVTRWRNRTVIPHPLMRPAVYRMLITVCEERMAVIP